MMICPIDFRYGREEMKSIFSRERKFQFMLDVEVALAYAHFTLGEISEEEYRDIERSESSVSIERADEIEREIKHDIMAMVRAFSEVCKVGGGVIHLGATSNDIIDTATALQFKAATHLIDEDLKDLVRAIADRAEEHKNTICAARTHGQIALPTTFGYKMTTFGYEFLRHIERLRESEKRTCAGKMMGAVGTGASFGSNAIKIEEKVMEKLELRSDEAPTQIVARDRYVELISMLANISTSAEKLATEIRNLQRTEIGEVSEPFDIEKQVGSSTMANKRNPITCENVCGLARIIRGFLTPMHESAILWHERDLSNSSAERFILPHCFILLDDILAKLAYVIKNMHINADRMKENLESSGKVMMAESLMMALTKKGMSRQSAHELIRKASMSDFDSVYNNEEVLAYMRIDEIDKALDYRSYLGVAVEKTERFLKKVER
jgi:adenylosuccinate lyase